MTRGQTITRHFCPACPDLFRTQRNMVEHATRVHGLTQSEAKGGWSRPADWDPCDVANRGRRFRCRECGGREGPGHACDERDRASERAEARGDA